MAKHSKNTKNNHKILVFCGQKSHMIFCQYRLLKNKAIFKITINIYEEFYKKYKESAHLPGNGFLRALEIRFLVFKMKPSVPNSIS